ncbi:hypothetical protein ETAA8_17200 [Anatilimnocola aggregata]|uniref:Cytochrome c domain-containing protein n=1 Tax=Anatilimnocola aggregata TaxID=2528021 RepID=A0A517Y8R6_9BACT|nr:hypothetical protein [Anatilimnocola aggregata]QDU26639.1 hypothetical protein ETAA8_17200 [Anatilimnocola aggregata]
MRRASVISLSFTSCLLIGFLAYQLNQREAYGGKDDEDEKVHELMEKTHEGKKSPWKKAIQASQANPIDWATINQALPRLADMSEALVTTKDKDVRDAADGYVAAVQELAMQANKRDTVRARAALTTLSDSCADCHYKGGPGGKLD